MLYITFMYKHSNVHSNINNKVLIKLHEDVYIRIRILGIPCHQGTSLTNYRMLIYKFGTPKEELCCSVEDDNFNTFVDGTDNNVVSIPALVSNSTLSF